MRDREVIMIGGDVYFVYEMTVRDIFSILYNLQLLGKGSFYGFLTDYRLISSITNCPLKVLLNLSVSELYGLYGTFMKLNKSFFSENNKKSITTEELITNLFSMYCVVVEAGHVGVMDYGFSFFTKSVSNYYYRKNIRLAENAHAFRVGQHGDDKVWKRYIRSLGVK